MCFHLDRCDILSVTKSKRKHYHALHGQMLESDNSTHFLGVTLTLSLIHISYYSRNNMSSNSRAAGAVFIFESDPQKRTCSQWVHSMLSFTYMMNQNITSVTDLYRGDISVTCHNSLPPDWDCLKWHHLSAPHLHSWRSSNTPKWSKQFLDG